jgi:peptidoglycan/xylan/chitin deacetylase (PgdA/CDA1 family)
MTKFNFISLLLLFLFSNLYSQEIAITIDDAPLQDGPLFSGRERAQKIISVLKKQNISTVAFFVITNNIDDAGKNRLMQYANAGHLLANHTHTHQWIHDIGVDRYIKSILTADSVLRLMKGFVPWFRYPFLDEGRTKTDRDSIRVLLKKLELMNAYVTIDNYDWYLNALLRKAINEKHTVHFERLRNIYIDHIWNSIQFYDNIARQILGKSPRHVLLLHENDLTAYFLNDLIIHLKTQGWKIISPIEAYKDRIATIIPDVLFNGQGRIAAMAKEKGVASKDLVQEAEDETYLDKLVKTKKVFE